MRIFFTRKANRAFRRLPPAAATTLRRRLERMAEDPERRDVDIKRLKGRPGYRLRFGDWRAIYDLDGDTIVVIAIGPRGEIYR
jgi:mRNA interferase RelE/StbE